MSNTTQAPLKRGILATRPFSASRFFLQWEWLLVVLLIAVNVWNTFSSPYYLNYDSIMSAIQMFLDKGMLVYPMMLVLLIGEIDISVASTMALSSVVMGMLFQAGVPLVLAICVALVVGLVCGMINGVILVAFPELSSMIVTLSTQILFRGIANILLENNAVTKFSPWFKNLAWGTVGSVPIILIVFLVLTVVFAYIVHCTGFGRQLFAMGKNYTTAAYSGIRVKRNKIIVFMIMGLFAAVAGIFLSSKTGSVRASLAQGYELDVIAIAVLGGVSTAGGKGRVIGVFLSTFILGLLRHGLGIANVNSQLILVIIGALLIVTVAIPGVKGYVQSFGGAKKPSKQTTKV